MNALTLVLAVVVGLAVAAAFIVGVIVGRGVLSPWVEGGPLRNRSPEIDQEYAE